MAHAHSLKENTGMIAGIAALSAAIGAATAMLITPRTGIQVRNGIRRRASHAKDRMTHRIQDSTDYMADNFEDIGEKAEDKIDRVARRTRRTTK